MPVAGEGRKANFGHSGLCLCKLKRERQGEATAVSTRCPRNDSSTDLDTRMSQGRVRARPVSSTAMARFSCWMQATDTTATSWMQATDTATSWMASYRHRDVLGGKLQTQRRPGCKLQTQQRRPGCKLQTRQRRPGCKLQTQRRPGCKLQTQRRPGCKLQTRQRRPGCKLQTRQRRPGCKLQTQRRPGCKLQTRQRRPGCKLQTQRLTLRASLSGTFLQRKDVVNQCLKFDRDTVMARFSCWMQATDTQNFKPE